MEYDMQHWQVEEVYMTPELAQKYLETNVNNRKIKKQKVHEYARDMENGNWDIAGDGAYVTISDEGLKNAQHRLNAIIKSGCSVPMLIIKPINREPRIIDRVAVRTLKDTIDMNGGIEGNAANSSVLGIINFMWANVFDFPNSDKPSAFEAMEYYREHYETLCDTIRICDHRPARGMKGYLANAGCKSAVYCALRSGVPYEVLDKFSKVVNTGIYEDKKELSAVVLRNMIISYDGTKTKSEGGDAYRIKLLKITQKAIIDFSKGVQRKRIYTENDYETFYSDFVKEKDVNRTPDTDKEIVNSETKIPTFDGKKCLEKLVVSSGFSSELINAMYDWLEYKKQKKQQYKEKGIEQFVEETKKRVGREGEPRVVSTIKCAIANNWNGCYFNNK